MTVQSSTDTIAEAVDEQATMRKIAWRIIPLIFVLYIIAYLDRTNIGYAALQMNAELALTAEAFGFASGIFFIGYFLFEIPSNVMLNKYGARIWIARILVTWGLLAIACGFVRNANELYILRFLLGAAEAGFFPGIIVYLTYWFRKKELATTFSLFTSAITVSFIIGAPVSTLIMDNIHWFGWSGWRWMLILEGIPAVLGGVVCFFYLTNRPQDAKWLTTAERDWLLGEFEKDKGQQHQLQELKPWQAVTNPKVLYIAILFFLYQCGHLGIGYWMPQIIKGFAAELSNTQIGFMATIPYILGTIVMIWWSTRSDRKNERRFHAAFPLAVASVTLLVAGLAQNLYLAMAMITLSLASISAFKGPFWSLPTLFLTQTTAAVSIAAINSIGNLGGFIGPYMVGLIAGGSKTATSGLIFLSALLLIASVMLALLRLPTSSKAMD